MKVWVLMVGYEADVVRVFTTEAACEAAAGEYIDKPGKPSVYATAECELEGDDAAAL
jgi:hypothetical protein